MDYAVKTAEELEILVNEKDMDAACELAKRYIHGTGGVAKNLSRAYQLYHKGEKRQHPGAFLGLAHMYEHGIYFAKNPVLAKEYYQKAGVEPPDHQGVPEADAANAQSAQSPMPSAVREKQSSVSMTNLRPMLQQAEELRQQSRYADAKNILQNLRRNIDSCRNGGTSQAEKDELDRLEVDANWLSGFIGFNEQNFTEALQYFAMNGVAALHPWSTYLSSVIHQMQNAARDVLMEDLQLLKEVQNNQNLSPEEKGDVLGMIAEIHMTGISDHEGDSAGCAYHYYSEAAKYGNKNAEEMLSRF